MRASASSPGAMPAMMGIVNLDKPVGPTSHDMVGLLRRLTQMRRIGHAGTLDPLASGVLPILIGPATRFSEELTGGSKRYEAVIRLGWRSATDDGEGPLARDDAPLPSPSQARDALERFVGRQEQRPPAFSARKLGGQTAHRAARAGEQLDLPPRPVTIERIDVLGWEEAADALDLRIDLRCGAGTYVRSLARDLGDRLGCGGYLAALRRTEAAGLRVDAALPPDHLEVLAAEGRLAEALIPVVDLLPLPRLELAGDEATLFRHGSALRPRSAAAEPGRYAVLSDHALLGVGQVAAGMLQPEKVIAEGMS
jgi:tRNA pseudouridine55 synthase